MIRMHTDWDFALIVVGIAWAIAAVKITKIIVTKGRAAGDSHER